MSFKVMNWAADQKAGGASVKLVLVMLADFAGEHGQSHYSNGRLAEICEMSVDTVQRALSKLESLGLIARIPTKRADGSQGTNLIVCLYCEAARAEAVRFGWVPQDATPPLPQIAAPAPRTGAGGPPHPCGTLREPSNNHQIPPNPPKAVEDLSADDRFSGFVSAWGFGPTDPLHPARRSFMALPPSEQGAATRYASAYLSACKQRGERPLKPQAWLRQKGWEGIAERSVDPLRGRSLATDTVWVPADSDEYRVADQDHRQRNNGRGLPIDSRGGWNIPIRRRLGDLPPPSRSFVAESAHD